MSLSTGAQIALIVIMFANLAGLAVLAACAFGIYRQTRGLSQKASTLMAQAEGVLKTAQETAVTVGERAEKVTSDVANKAERVAYLSEQVAERVAQRVDTTSAIVQEAIANPVINLASVRTGIGKGLEVWQELSKAKGGNGK